MAHTFPKTRCEICGKPAHEWLHRGEVSRQHKIALKARRWNRQRQKVKTINIVALSILILISDVFQPGYWREVKL